MSYVVATLKENITLLNGDGRITIGNVFIGKTTDDIRNIRVLEVVGVIVGRSITMLKNTLTVAAPSESVWAVQLGVSEDWVKSCEPIDLKEEKAA